MNMEPTPFVTYDERGMILNVGRVPQFAVAAQQFDAFGVIEGEALADKNWVDPATATIQTKTNSPIVMVGDVFTNVPPDSWAVHEGVRYPIDDATVEFEFDLPGEYHVTINSVRHLPFTHTITVA